MDTSVQPKPVSPARTYSELGMYIRTLVFSLVLYGALYFYTLKMGIPGTLNKATADTSIVLIALSMLMSSLSYFFNVFDSKIKYRKHLGLIGFAFGVAHIGLSFSALQALFNIAVWQKGAMWPALTGALATVIFIIMTLISNRMAMTKLGVNLWRNILRTGYIAMLLVLAHVVLLKSPRWITWIQGGMKTPPSTSFMVSIFVVIVVVMRLVMWLKIRFTPKAPATASTPSAPVTNQ